MPKYSIIIPVRHINDFLRENIGYLKALEYKDFEVLIVRDSEKDKTEIYDFGGDTRFKLLVSGPVGPGEKRNLGAKQAQGEILAFLDDDAFPFTNWLTEADKIFLQSDPYALGGPAITPLNAEFSERLSGRVLESWMTSAGTKYRHVPSVEMEIDDYPSVNLFVKRDAFQSVGGFSKEFWPGEDTKLCLDLLKKYNKKFLYSPRPIVYHHRRRLFLPHLKQVSRYGRHRGQFARIFPENSRVLSYFIPSFFVLGLLLGPILSLIFKFLWPVYLGVMAFYVILLCYEASRVMLKEKSPKAFCYTFLGILFTHLIYGANFIVGFIKRPRLELRGFDSATGNYIGG